MIRLLNSESCPPHPQVLLKLFSYCVKVKINRQQLVKPEMNTLNVMLGTLNLVGFTGRGRNACNPPLASYVNPKS